MVFLFDLNWFRISEVKWNYGQQSQALIMSGTFQGAFIFAVLCLALSHLSSIVLRASCTIDRFENVGN